MMKKIIFVLLLLSSSNSVLADNLCEKWKPEIKERRDENSFNKENYLKALKALEFYATNQSVDPWQSVVIVNGFLLKHDAKNNTHSLSLKRFCEFIVMQDVHRG